MGTHSTGAPDRGGTEQAGKDTRAPLRALGYALEGNTGTAAETGLRSGHWEGTGVPDWVARAPEAEAPGSDEGRAAGTKQSW